MMEVNGGREITLPKALSFPRHFRENSRSARGRQNMVKYFKEIEKYDPPDR
jgi:hypothetical protein